MYFSLAYRPQSPTLYYFRYLFLFVVCFRRNFTCTRVGERANSFTCAVVAFVFRTILGNTFTFEISAYGIGVAHYTFFTVITITFFCPALIDNDVIVVHTIFKKKNINNSDNYLIHQLSQINMTSNQVWSVHLGIVIAEYFFWKQRFIRLMSRHLVGNLNSNKALCLCGICKGTKSSGLPHFSLPLDKTIDEQPRGL